jgi:hypothetical protein
MLSGKLGKSWLDKAAAKYGGDPMDAKLVAACQMFLVPASIIFAALGVATSEALKTLLSAIGVVVSTAWLYRLYRWTGLPSADANTAWALADVFFVASVISVGVHLRLWHKEWENKGWTGFLATLK